MGEARFRERLLDLTVGSREADGRVGVRSDHGELDHVRPAVALRRVDGVRLERHLVGRCGKDDEQVVDALQGGVEAGRVGAVAEGELGSRRLRLGALLLRAHERADVGAHLARLADDLRPHGAG